MEKVSKFFASNFARSRFLGRIQNRVLKKKKKSSEYSRRNVRHKFLHFRLIYNFELCKGRS